MHEWCMLTCMKGFWVASKTSYIDAMAVFGIGFSLKLYRTEADSTVVYETWISDRISDASKTLWLLLSRMAPIAIYFAIPCTFLLYIIRLALFFFLATFMVGS